MFARVTHFEINIAAIAAEDAVERFKALILPDLRVQDGYAGLYVLRAHEGKGLLVTLWESQEAGEKGITSGFYDKQVAKVASLSTEPLSREDYEVVYSELPQRLRS
jgi:heme-degrading monooxygenase HmoA